MDGGTVGWSDGWTARWSDGQKVGRSDGPTVGRSDGQTVGWSDSRTDRRSDGRTVLFLAAYTLRIAPGSTFGVLECVGGFWALQTYFCGTKPEDFIREDTHVWCVYTGKGATKTIQSKYEKIHFSEGGGATKTIQCKYGKQQFS